MTVFSSSRRLLLLAPLVLWLSGCFNAGQRAADEEKEPNYLAGVSRLNSMDFKGAIQMFEKALTANPDSAAAHLQLAFLYEEKENNYAAAIYHFQKHLALRPKSNLEETIKQRVFSCTLELARTVPFTMVSGQVQNDLRRLRDSNQSLLQQVEQLKAELNAQAADFSNRLALASQVQAPTPQRQAPPATVTPSYQDRRSSIPDRSPTQASFHAVPRSTTPTPSTSSPRVHIVKPGETLATISRRYNIKLSSLQSANPRVDPRKLRAGQVLHLPGTR